MMLRFLICLVALCRSAVDGVAADLARTAADPGSPTNFLATPLSLPRWHHLFRVTTRIYSGETPADDTAFAALAELGVKTIISVDGAKPDADAAHRHGLRYIHLPFGYDGIPANRVAALTRGAKSGGGALYVHCHHGMHRGPAAVAVICEATAGWTTNQAVAWLQLAGTAPEYAGLYRSAITFRPPTTGELDDVGELPEVAVTSSRIETMVAIDEAFARLKASQQIHWSPFPGQSDLSPASTAVLLWEHFRELQRTDNTASHPGDYAEKLAHTVGLADQLRTQLQDSKAEISTRDTALQSLGQACVHCHRQFRN